MFKFFLIGAVLISLGSGQGIDFSLLNSCGRQSGQDGMPCFVPLLDFAKNNLLNDWAIPERNQEFRKSCNSLQQCLSTLQCSAAQNVWQTTRIFCDSMNFIGDNFGECMYRNRINSKCFNGNNPQVPDKSCSNPFGKNNCMKKEIVENCGQQAWIGYRDNYLSAVSIAFPDCNFDEYRNL